MKSFWNSIVNFLDRYSILVAAVVIYSYFLLTSINLMEHAKTKKTFLDFVLQFDSLIFLWIIAFVVVQLQKYRRLNSEQALQQRRIQSDIEQQRTKLRILDEVTLLLQESINKPLAVVSANTRTMRQRFHADAEARSWIDHIDFALARVHTTISEIKTYETQKIVGEIPVLTESTPSPG